MVIVFRGVYIKRPNIQAVQIMEEGDCNPVEIGTEHWLSWYRIFIVFCSLQMLCCRSSGLCTLSSDHRKLNIKPILTS